MQVGHIKLKPGNYSKIALHECIFLRYLIELNISVPFPYPSPYITLPHLFSSCLSITSVLINRQSLTPQPLTQSFYISFIGSSKSQLSIHLSALPASPSRTTPPTFLLTCIPSWPEMPTPTSATWIMLTSLAPSPD